MELPPRFLHVLSHAYAKGGQTIPRQTRVCDPRHTGCEASPGFNKPVTAGAFSIRSGADGASRAIRRSSKVAALFCNAQDPPTVFVQKTLFATGQFLSTFKASPHRSPGHRLKGIRVKNLAGCQGRSLRGGYHVDQAGGILTAAGEHSRTPPHGLTKERKGRFVR